MKKAKKTESLTDIEQRGKRLEALINITNKIRDKEYQLPISFNDFLYLASERPHLVFRDIFQFFYDMVHYFVPAGNDEYPSTPETVGFYAYNMNQLFVNDCEPPFFADRLFANRFMNLAQGFRQGIQNNRIYLFEGPPGSGKSTFLNNLLSKLEEYSKTPVGAMYRTRWCLDIEKLGGFKTFSTLLEKQSSLAADKFTEHLLQSKVQKTLEFSCPNHDHPILQIPVEYRKQFLDELITDEEFKEELFTTEQYKWVMKDKPCSICNSLFSLVLDALGDPLLVYQMLHARVSRFNRQFGEGISIFNPGDPLHDRAITNVSLQNEINNLFNNDDIKFVYSYLANTNNGVFALMDIKENNVHRLKSLHGIISDGIHKVELVEECIKSIFVGLVNPEDKVHYENVKSFQDRIITVNIPYILDFTTEVAIYKNKFGKKIESEFLPRIIENFAKIIISTRLEKQSPAIYDWLENSNQYTKYIDKNLFLLKMDLYAGRIPKFLTEADNKRFTAEVRKKVLRESEMEGIRGISGRKSLNLFNAFYARYSQSGKLISMDMVVEFFNSDNKLIDTPITEGFIDSLVDLYDFNILQEIKEAIYYYNDTQISKDILNYLFAINFEISETKYNPDTGDNVDISEEYFKNFEALILGSTIVEYQRKAFRKEQQHEYVTNTLSQEIKLKNIRITETQQYKNLFEKYTKNLKENALAPYKENPNFRRAIIDYDTPAFETYDVRLKRDIMLLIDNMVKKFNYSPEGAQQVCLYVLDKKIVKKF